VRILVTGAAGLLGSQFVAQGRGLGYDVTGTDRAEVDVTDEDAVREAVDGAPYDWVVHCAAYTAVDRAESEPEEAFAVNGEGTRTVASAAADAGVRMVYISTDYVFDGRKRTPYRVGDRPNPLSVYGKSKRAGERAVRRRYDERAGWGLRPLIVRTGWLYGAGGRGFVRTILDRAREGVPLRVVQDQTGRPTAAANVAAHTLALMARKEAGIWHVADGGSATWLDLAREAVALDGVDAEIEGVSTETWGAAAPRPAYSVLDVSRTEEALGRPMQAWPEALRSCLAETDTVAPR
jgi:dTDP-4-dehydrorhamnose reductase